MSETLLQAPLDQREREFALNPTRSILVQAPAGSGKTTLLTERFLTLLGQVDEPGQVVAITFTNAAAAEMRNRVLDALRAAELGHAQPASAASLALARANASGWKLLDLPAQLRIGTIDSFCRELALQQPLLSGLGSGLAIAEQPAELYRRAARHTLQEIGRPALTEVGAAVQSLLLWRDNNWQELEELLVQMLANRARWMQDFVLSRHADWDALRARLERPFANAVRQSLEAVSALLDQAPHARSEALELTRFACGQECGEQHRPLAELAEFPLPPFLSQEKLDEAHHALICLGNLVLTGVGSFRAQIDKRLGFPADRKAEKGRLLRLIDDLRAVDGLGDALCAARALPPARYTEEEWEIVKACFQLLRHAAGQLKVVFAEAAAVDFTEVAQMAEAVLKSPDGLPSDAALAIADGIRHLLVDEFQDTSRRQHQLLSLLIAAWPEPAGRTLFAVGDPMQSIYFFREADAELFGRVRQLGLEIPGAEPLKLDFVQLSANFRTVPPLIRRLNRLFHNVFAHDDGSGVAFAPAEPALKDLQNHADSFMPHVSFIPQVDRGTNLTADARAEVEAAAATQTRQILQLIHSHRGSMLQAAAVGGKFRIAVLGRARKSLTPIAEALREANLPFRAIDLEKLGDRPEVLDALSLGRALLNAQDRVAWLGVLRAPWCGLDLADLHTAAGGDDAPLLDRPVPELLRERRALLSAAGQRGAERVLAAVSAAGVGQTAFPSAPLGTWLQRAWLLLGGADCYDAAARANLDLLWNCLDQLPAGAADLLGPALDTALEKLTALPDPHASADIGVQLMTIHKSKGLEFEVVIVPDLQAKASSGARKMLSWMERGVAPSMERGVDPSHAESDDAITEFLIAPLPTRGGEAGAAKRWVDGVYRRREEQEMRRLLYVAATRARDQLHLFARTCYSVAENGDLTLPDPSAGLLKTAWPGLEEEVRAQFETWKSTSTNHSQMLDLAASSAEQPLTDSASRAAGQPAPLVRLSEDYPIAAEPAHAATPGAPTGALAPGALYRRHEGGLASRALGTAVHTLLEALARQRQAGDWDAARAAVLAFKDRILAQVRAIGTTPQDAEAIAAEALHLVIDASHSPVGQWILTPRTDAASELSWTGLTRGKLNTVRVDRVFRAGLTPLSEGQAAWWIIDYKTAQADDVATLRPLFADQLETYARLLRSLHGQDAVVRGGLFYPRLSFLDWWEI